MSYQINSPFPYTLSWNSEYGLDTNVALLSKTSGQRMGIGRWNGEQRVYNAAQGIKIAADLTVIKNHWRRRGGSLDDFPLLDLMDHTTASDSRSAQSMLDHVIGTGDGATVDFQLITRLTDADGSLVRNIQKPKMGTVRVAVGGTQKVEGTHFTVNYMTGIVTFDSGSIPALAANITAGCEYYIPVFYGSNAASQFRATNLEADLMSLSIPLIESFNTGIIQDDAYYGGGSLQPVTADLQVVRQTMGETIRFQPTAAHVIFLESPTAMECGHRLTLWNDNASAFSLTLKSLGATVATLTAGTVAELHVFATSTSRTWKAV